MLNDRFVRGYLCAILLILLFSAAFRLGSILGEELQVATEQDRSVRALRRIHERDQKEARSDK